jgi:hypothetical protein
MDSRAEGEGWIEEMQQKGRGQFSARGQHYPIDLLVLLSLSLSLTLWRALSLLLSLHLHCRLIVSGGVRADEAQLRHSRAHDERIIPVVTQGQ